AFTSCASASPRRSSESGRMLTSSPARFPRHKSASCLYLGGQGYLRVVVGCSILEDVTLPLASKVVWMKKGLKRLFAPPGAITLIVPACETMCFTVLQARLEHPV